MRDRSRQDVIVDRGHVEDALGFPIQVYLFERPVIGLDDARIAAHGDHGHRRLPDKRDESIAHTRSVLLVAPQHRSQGALFVDRAPCNAQDEQRSKYETGPGAEQ
jgi:hypothetical protein